MADFYEKDPMDCNAAELDAFLAGRGIREPKKLLKSEKIRMAINYLQAEGRSKVRFSKPETFWKKAVYHTKRLRSKNSQRKEGKSESAESEKFNQASVGDSVRSDNSGNRMYSPPPIFTKKHPFDPPLVNDIMSTQVENQNYTLPVFDPSPIASDSSSYQNFKPVKKINHIYAEPELVFRTPPAIPPRLPKKTKKLNPSIISSEELFRGKPEKIAAGEVSTKHEPVSRQNLSQNELFSRDESNARGQTIIQPVVRGFKFTAIYDPEKLDIEDYVVNLSRWKRATNTPDEAAILQGLQNFKQTSAANYISETLTAHELTNFDEFTSVLMRKLGKTPRQWYAAFCKATRRKDESCDMLMGKLSSHLRLGTGVGILTQEHQAMVVERFLDCLHPELRGFLEARDEPVNYENAAEIANRVELARNIPRVKPAAIVSNTEVIKAEVKPSYNKVQRKCYGCGDVGHLKADFPNPNAKSKIKCPLCRRAGHTIDYCYGNPHGKNPNPAKFLEIQKGKKNSDVSGN